MSKRVYLPELKRRITVLSDGGLKICKPVEGENDELPDLLMCLPYPECRRYEVRYRQFPNGKYLAKKSVGSSLCIDDAETKRYIQLCCFLPESWIGKKFNRYVKVVY